MVRLPRIPAEYVLLGVLTAVIGGLAAGLGLAGLARVWVLILLAVAGTAGACAIAEWTRYKNR